MRLRRQSDEDSAGWEIAPQRSPNRRDGSARTQVANSFIVSLRLGAGLGRQILVPSQF